MKVIIKIQRSPEQLFLADFANKDLINKVRSLINRGKHKEAIAIMLANSKSLKKLKKNNLKSTAASLIITEKNTHWDLTHE